MDKAIVIKTAWYWHQNRHVEQNREPRNKRIHVWSINLQLSEARLYNGEKTVSSESGAGKAGYSHVNQ